MQIIPNLFLTYITHHLNKNILLFGHRQNSYYKKQLCILANPLKNSAYKWVIYIFLTDKE